MRDQNAQTAMRRLIEDGPTDPRILARLTLLEELQVAVAKGDTKEQLELGRKLAANAKEIQAAEAEQRAMMLAAIGEAQTALDPDDRAAKLCAAFALCAEVQHNARDSFGGGEAVTRAVEHKHGIVAALDAITPQGRLRLAKLLDHPNAGVRASAGAHLLNANLMRERVVPILQEIEKNDDDSAGWTAFWALSPNDHGAWLTGEAGANRKS
jgi:hypothetical protein